MSLRGALDDLLLVFRQDVGADTSTVDGGKLRLKL